MTDFSIVHLLRNTAATLAVLAAAGCAAAPRPADGLDAGDRAGISQATQQALEGVRTGESVNWANSATGHGGSVTPVATYISGSGAPCRNFRHTAVAGGRTLVAHDTACRGDDGTWRSVTYASVAGSLDAARYAPPPPAYYYPAPYYWPLHTSIHLGYWGWRGRGHRHYRRGSRFHLGYGLHF